MHPLYCDCARCDPDFDFYEPRCDNCGAHIAADCVCERCAACGATHPDLPEFAECRAYRASMAGPPPEAAFAISR